MQENVLKFSSGSGGNNSSSSDSSGDGRSSNDGSGNVGNTGGETSCVTVYPEPGAEEVRFTFKGKQGYIGGTEWTEDMFLSADIHVEQELTATVRFDFFDDGNTSKWPDISLRYKIMPNMGVRVAFSLRYLSSRSVFLPVRPCTFKGTATGKPVEPGRISRFDIVLPVSPATKKVTVGNLRLTGTDPGYIVDDVILVDEIGQLTSREWPGKTKNAEEMIDFLTSEYAGSIRGEVKQFSGRNRFGGWEKKKFGPSGFFRIEHDGRRYWLVDPDGCAFFSSGMCYGSRMGEFGWTDRIEKLFKWLPDKNDPRFTRAWITAGMIPEFVKREGADAGKGRFLFNFARANMIRAFGDKWQDCWTAITRSRFAGWGINTVGIGVNNYEDEDTDAFLTKTGIPYTITLKNYPRTGKHIFRDFPDVFSREYEINSAVFARQIVKHAEDPLLVGYFVANEAEWGFSSGNATLAEQLLDSGYEFETKNAFIDFISRKYNGDISLFNNAWNTRLSCFDGLRARMRNAASLSEQAKNDLEEFSMIMVRQYNRVPCMAVKNLDPVHLNLGARCASTNRNYLAENDYFDVFSFNKYIADPAESIDNISRITGKPVIIGEFHFGSTDRGLLSSGLVNTASQAERGKAYRHYMETAAASPACVGAHYFEYNDQPVTGRFDGENMQFGFIDCCNKPYYEFVEMVRETNRGIYEVADGLSEAYNHIIVS